MSRLVVIALCVGFTADSVVAQVLLQQPVVGVTGVQTVASVPDRGSALLGRVDRAKDSRATYGFSPFGSSLGREVNRTGTDVSVTIHDFEAMDRWLLSQPRPGDHRFHQASTANAWSQLGGETSRIQASSPATIANSPQAVSRVATPEARLLQMGDSALAKSDRLGALGYYRAARRLGSNAAAQKIELILGAVD